MIGNVYDCSTNPYTDLYAMPFILKLDRSRWSGSGFDWTVLPAPGPSSAPLIRVRIVNDAPGPTHVILDVNGYYR